MIHLSICLCTVYIEYLLTVIEFSVTVVQLLTGDAGLQSSHVVALGEIARHTQLPVPVGDVSSLSSKASSDPESKESSVNTKEATLVNVFRLLQSIFNNNKLTSKTREQAIQTAGYLCVGDSGSPLRPAIIKELLDIANKVIASCSLLLSFLFDQCSNGDLLILISL